MTASTCAAAAEGLPNFKTVKKNQQQVLPPVDPEGEIHKLNHLFELAFDDLAELVNAACTNRVPDVNPHRRQAVAYALYEMKYQVETLRDAYWVRVTAGAAA